MRELSLFSGAGGGLLATKWMLGWRTIGYVEWDAYCQRVIAQRIKDGLLDPAPIFGDIRVFIDSGCAELYRGVTDIITAGFPCQPFSVAGKQKGAEDDRNMWPATAQVISIVRPLRVLLENVPGIRRYLPVVVRDLRRIGYAVRRPLILGASDCGAPHRRKRIWIVADAISNDIWIESGGCPRKSGQNQMESSGDGKEGPMAYPKEQIDGDGEARTSQGQIQQPGECDCKGDISYPPKQYGTKQRQEASKSGCSGKDVSDTTKQGLSKPRSAGKREQGEEGAEGLGNRFAISNWWAVEPRLGRVAHGVAHRVDRLKAIGNGQVPIVVARVWEILSHE